MASRRSHEAYHSRGCAIEISYSLQLKGCHKQHLIAIYVFFVEEAIDARIVWQNIGKKMGRDGAALTIA